MISVCASCLKDPCDCPVPLKREESPPLTDDDIRAMAERWKASAVVDIGPVNRDLGRLLRHLGYL